MRTERHPGSGIYENIECPYGVLFSFDHIDCNHGSEINATTSTVVSFDFRIALSDLYFETSASSVNTKSEFKPGSYFSSYAISK